MKRPTRSIGDESMSPQPPTQSPPPHSSNVAQARGEPPGETMLTGGVSSDIRIVHAPDGSYVVKRALGKLKVKADWFSDPARSSIEVSGLRALARLLGQSHAPRVLWTDAPAHRFAMELIEPRFENWKVRLLRGEVDISTARAAGRLLGLLHTRSANADEVRREFANIEWFIELRIRPFFERVAQKNPPLAAAITRTVEHIHQSRCALVHGDYSPKNLLVDGDEIVILDCEVAHWGDPRFDIAFCIAHLLLKSFRHGAPTAVLLDAATAFLREYRQAGPPVLDEHLLRQTGCLLLARLEGDSPVEYLHELDTGMVKRFATELLMNPSTDVEPRIRARGTPSA